MFDFSSIHFIRPWFILLAIPGVLFLMHYFRQQKSQQNNWQSHIDSELLDTLMINQSHQKRSIWSKVFAYLCLYFGVIAMMGPSWSQLPQTVYKKQNALVIVLDLSLSMYAEDGTPNRLSQAKFKIKDILKQRNSDLTALIVYSNDAFTVTPLTDDPNTIKSLIDSLSPEIMPSHGSNPVAALQKANELISQASLSNADVLLIADDIEDNQINDAAAALSPKASLGVLAIGKTEGAPILLPDNSYLSDQNQQLITATQNTSGLKKLAKKHGGRFHAATVNDDDINSLLSNQQSEQAQKVKRKFDSWEDAGYYFVFALLALSLLAFRRGQVLAGFAVFALLSLQPTPSYAAWKDWFQNDKQQAVEAYQHGNAEQSLSFFEQRANQNTSNKNRHANDVYNYANALAKSKQYQKAIEQYDRALQANPDLKDAQFNKKLVEKLLEQQEQEKNKEQQKNSSDDKEKQDSQEQESQNQESQNQNQQQDEQDDQQQKSEDKQQQQDNQQDSQQDQNQSKDQQQRQQKEQEKAQQEKQHQQKEQEKQQKAEANEQQKKPGDKESEKMEARRSDENIKDAEEARVEQMKLDQLESDPSYLLRRKFEYQRRQKQRQGNTPYQRNEKFW